MAAQHLTTGRAVGVDLWRSLDQSGNSAEATRRNAVAEGVADRVELHTADMSALPFEDDSFDLIVSNFAIHNISGRAGREKAIADNRANEALPLPASVKSTSAREPRSPARGGPTPRSRSARKATSTRGGS
jgi:hypothetical protein